MTRGTLKAGLAIALAFAATSCAVDRELGSAEGELEDPFTELDPEDAAQPGYNEGVAADEIEGADLEAGGNKSAYEVPTELPVLANPEIIISKTKPLVVHVFDRETGFSAVYPTGIGVLGSTSGVSITPSGHFTVGTTDHTNSWYWIKRRSSPDYFGGLPFLRMSIENSKGHQTYGLHGPITSELLQDYVSHGCMRMRPEDVVDLFWMLYNRRETDPEAPATPIAIVPGQALDATGAVLAEFDEAVIWEPGEPIDWAAMSAESRPDSTAPTSLE
jgi:L,D-transpeptidase catalytic domain